MMSNAKLLSHLCWCGTRYQQINKNVHCSLIKVKVLQLNLSNDKKVNENWKLAKSWRNDDTHYNRKERETFGFSTRQNKILVR